MAVTSEPNNDNIACVSGVMSCSRLADPGLRKHAGVLFFWRQAEPAGSRCCEPGGGPRYGDPTSSSTRSVIRNLPDEGPGVAARGATSHDLAATEDCCGPFRRAVFFWMSSDGTET